MSETRDKRRLAFGNLEFDEEANCTVLVTWTDDDGQASKLLSARECGRLSGWLHGLGCRTAVAGSSELPHLSRPGTELVATSKVAVVSMCVFNDRLFVATSEGVFERLDDGVFHEVRFLKAGEWP
jgi:hypothetical protein